MDIKLNGHDFRYDITSMAMMFFPNEKINYVLRSNSDLRARSLLKSEKNKYISVSTVFYNNQYYRASGTAGEGCDIKNLVKRTFYLACTKATGITSPWGILTGIRPLSVYVRHKLSGDDPEAVLKNDYFLTNDKISLLSCIYNIQKHLICSGKKDVSVYISIPFCPSKCSYCSFVSVAATNKFALLSEYLNLLCREIVTKAGLIKEFGLNIKSIYIGGGTPGILSEDELIFLLDSIKTNFDTDNIQEFCFELGRPETASAKKLEILKKFGVSRVCINTQTTNEIILEKVNRKHNLADYITAINLTKSYSFDCINTDLIAGLPDESFESFCKSVDDVINTGLDNITVHTLAIKKSSALSCDKNSYEPVNAKVSAMLEYAYKKLSDSGYFPYYIYRQKNCVSNGENIGFCKSDKACLYNIYMMEDVHSVISCGAGASTKLIEGNKVDRFINVKYPMEYVREYEKVDSNSNKIREKLKEMFKND